MVHCVSETVRFSWIARNFSHVYMIQILLVWFVFSFVRFSFNAQYQILSISLLNLLQEEEQTAVEQKKMRALQSKTATLHTSKCIYSQ